MSLSCGGGGDGSEARDAPPQTTPPQTLEAAAAPTVTPTAVPASSDSTAESRAAAIAAELPLDFSIVVYNGEDVLGGSEVTLSELLARGKPVIVNFWAGLCSPCRDEMPDLQSVYDEYIDEVLLVGVDFGAFTGLGNTADALALIEETGVSYPTGKTEQAEVKEAYGLIAMPATFFIRPDGTVFETWVGAMSRSIFKDLVLRLIFASL